MTSPNWLIPCNPSAVLQTIATSKRLLDRLAESLRPKYSVHYSSDCLKTVDTRRSRYQSWLRGAAPVDIPKELLHCSIQRIGDGGLGPASRAFLRGRPGHDAFAVD